MPRRNVFIDSNFRSISIQIRGGKRRKELETNLNKFKKNNVTLNKFYISNNVTT